MPTLNLAEVINVIPKTDHAFSRNSLRIAGHFCHPSSNSRLNPSFHPEVTIFREGKGGESQRCLGLERFMRFAEVL